MATRTKPRRVIWAGAFVGAYHERMTALHWDDGQTTRSRNCTVCRTESPWRHSPKGWAIHPNCGENTMDLTAPEVVVEAVFNLAASFPRLTQLSAPSRPAQAPARVLGNPAAGCDICGAPYAAPWLVARVWRCGAHRLSVVPAKTPYWWA